MVTALTDASLRFSVKFSGVNIGSAAINPLLLKGQVVNVDEPTLERDTINYTGSGITTEIIQTVLQPMEVTYTLAGWNDHLLELVENASTVCDVERWLRAKDGILTTQGRRIAASWAVAAGTTPGWQFRHSRYTGRLRDPRSDAGEQGTAISNVILVQQVNRLERFNILGGLWRYIDMQTGENLIAEAGTRSTRTTTDKAGLIALG